MLNQRSLIELLRATRPAGALLAIAALAACGSETGPPEVVLDQSACDRCGMLISEPRFAAAYRAGDHTAVFDDIGCLLEALDEAGLQPRSAAARAGERGGRADQAEVWLLDSRERWIPAAEAVFVRSQALQTPMGGGIQAVADRAEAERLAASVGGSIFESLAELSDPRVTEQSEEERHDPSR